MKRALDVTITLMALPPLCPLWLLAALLVRLDGPGPLLFRQERSGRHGRPFIILKFRSMAGGGQGIAASAPHRVTRLGRLLRASKLDELPQLINVLKGEMSLVGPRPELPSYVALWPEADRAAVLSVRPGITDFASLIYRQEETLLAGRPDPEDYYRRVLIPQKLRLARFYVCRAGPGLDLWLLGQTARALLRLPSRLAPRRPRPS